MLTITATYCILGVAITINIAQEARKEVRMNYEKLTAAVQRSGLKQSFIAKEIGVSDAVMHNRLTGASQFRLNEVSAICRVLKLSKKDRESIFFDEV